MELGFKNCDIVIFMKTTLLTLLLSFKGLVK